MVKGCGEALRELQKKGYIFIVVTNQGGVALGLYTEAEVHQMHGRISGYLSQFDVAIREYYYCPHHSKVSQCLCRKPGSLMLEKAIARFKIDAANSWFIGDNARDIEAGAAAGVRTLLVPSNADLRNYADERF